MIEISHTDFERVVGEAIDALPRKYAERTNNLVFMVEDEPTADQRRQLHLVNGQTLYGLYQGIPQSRRSSGYHLALPDKITIFKRPIEVSCSSFAELKEKVRYTIWHEVAHHFGLDHDQIAKLDGST